MKLLTTFALLAASTVSLAQTYVNPYTKNDGTYVQGHYKSAPDHNAYNNYSSQGNSNPYTGQQGTRDPVQAQQQYQPSQPSYGGSNNYYGQPSRQRSGY